MLEALDPERPGLPTWALLRAGPIDGSNKGRQLLRHYLIGAPVVKGRFYGLYRLEAK